MGLGCAAREPQTVTSTAELSLFALPHPNSLLFITARFNLTNPKHKLLLQQAFQVILHSCLALLWQQVEPLVPRISYERHCPISQCCPMKLSSSLLQVLSSKFPSRINLQGPSTLSQVPREGAGVQL